MSGAAVRMYVRLIQGGRRTLEDVPAEYREAVKAILEEAAEDDRISQS